MQLVVKPERRADRLVEELLLFLEKAGVRQHPQGDAGAQQALPSDMLRLRLKRER